MWQQEFIWFFAIFHQEFRKNNPIAVTDCVKLYLIFRWIVYDLLREILGL
jgi:hypothetical protein